MYRVACAVFHHDLVGDIKIVIVGGARVLHVHADQLMELGNHCIGEMVNRGAGSPEIQA